MLTEENITLKIQVFHQFYNFNGCVNKPKTTEIDTKHYFSVKLKDE